MIVPVKLKVKGKSPLHLKEHPKCKELLVTGYIDQVTTEQDGYMTAEDKANLEKLLVQMAAVISKIAVIFTKLTTIFERLDAIDVEITNIKNIIAEIQNTITEIQASIKVINETLLSLSNQITDIQNDITVINKAVENINTTITNIQERLNSNEADIIAIKADIVNITNTINQLEGLVTEFNLFEVVATLPTTNIDINKIYLVPLEETEENNIFAEWINPTGTEDGWELIGNISAKISTGGSDTYVIKPSTGVVFFNNTSLSTTITFQLYKGEEVLKITSYNVRYYLEGSSRTGTSYREITLSDDSETLSVVVKRNNLTQRSGYLSVSLYDTSSHYETISLPVMSTSNSFLLAQGRISVYDGIYEDSFGHRLDVEDCYAGQLYHYYKTFDGSEINLRWLTRGRYFLEMPKEWEDYFGTFNEENIQMHAQLSGVGSNEFARFLVFSIQAAGEYSSVGTVSENCWGAVSVYGEIEKDATVYGSDVHTATTQEAPIRYSIWYNSLAGSWKSYSLYEREDGSALTSGLRVSLSYNVSTDGAAWPDTGTYEPTLNVQMLIVDPSTNEIIKDTVTPTSVTYSVINAPEGKVTVDENTGVVIIDASGTGALVQFTIQAYVTYMQGDIIWRETASFSGYIRS